MNQFSIFDGVVSWLVTRDFWYRGDIKHVVFLKHGCSARSRSKVRPTSNVTSIARDLYYWLN